MHLKENIFLSEGQHFVVKNGQFPVVVKRAINPQQSLFSEFTIFTESGPPGARFRANRPFVFVLRVGVNTLFTGVYHP